MNPCEVAYYAGYFDGEGSIQIGVNNHKALTSPQHTLRCSITSNNGDICKSYKASFGGHLTSYFSQQTNKILWAWGTNANLAMAFLETISPFLRQKKQEATIAINFQLNRRGLSFTERDAVRYQLHNLKNNRRKLRDYAKLL